MPTGRLTNPVRPLTLQRAFPGMSETEAREMIASGIIRTFPPGTIICREGAVENTFYILLHGEVEVTKFFNETEARVLKRLHQGDFFGEMAIIHEAPRAATITTTDICTVLEIGKEAFAGWLERSSSMSMAMVREVSKRLRENDEMAIEDLRQKARELAAAYQQLADQEAARSEFLSTIAHELRTPLMAANGFLQIARTGKLSGEALSAALDTIGRHINDIISLVNNLLFLQEMELILPEFQPLDIGAVVASAVEQQRAGAERSQVRLRLDIAPALPNVSGDVKSLERAFSAIIDNAIKFSPDGGDVDIEVGTERQEVWIRVRDRGIGIQPEIRPRIFERFFHVDKMGNHLFRGVGLGLSIARQVIEQHHGRILLESEVGAGSTFTIFMQAKDRK